MVALYTSRNSSPSLRQTAGRAGDEAQIAFKVHPHMLRHACGYALANKGLDTRALQAYLGHRSIIEGGGRGPPDRSSGQARYHLRQAIIEILRSLVRGYDAEARVANHLTELHREIVEAKLDPDKVVSDVLFEANKDLDHNIDRDIDQDQWEPIVLRALQVAAETLADDPGAKGRV
jgi:Phage integrase family